MKKEYLTPLIKVHEMGRFLHPICTSGGELTPVNTGPGTVFDDTDPDSD